MKQGTKRKLAPKDKHDKRSWQTRNAARAAKQHAHAEAKHAIEVYDAAHAEREQE